MKKNLREFKYKSKGSLASLGSKKGVGKIYFLNVPDTIIATHGAVSKQTAYYMAKGLSNYKNTDFSLALTGIAGPSGGTLKKPIGLVYFSFCIKLYK